MKSIRIADSYCTWKTNEMKSLIQRETINKYHIANAADVLDRSYESMYVEWWLHNVGYYLTKPLCWIDYLNTINGRFKHVDLEEWD